MSLTGDIWTSITIDAYITLTVHFLSEAWEMCSVVLGTKPLSDRHTGENIVAWMEEMLALAPIRWLHLSMIAVQTSILLDDDSMTSMAGTLKPVPDTHFSYV